MYQAVLYLIYSLRYPWEVDNIISQFTNEELKVRGNLLRFIQKK